MQITVNGEGRDVEAGLTVAGLLGVFGLPERKVAIERNREIVPKSTYADTALADGDKIEIVAFVGGG
ncbi:sulfur carrier protein ThiS [Parvularcula dongshanensis]|uniref:Thiamine biosynthesis protein ThiS n=1 Tax=Parvularcula dongshanensis TaxID=1173995 RepID=A0A840I4Z4_9PROT|nr:sulfur carrier protein ThiS [Parvularcula dongshanensis]MBB4659857.1 thiamine biosynthesis protein ThiS [Parvularcula dongshanensis]